MEKLSPILNNQTSSVAGFATTRKELFFKPVIQSKLTINQPNDVYEQEADVMADKVMRMTGNENMQESFFKPAISSLQRKCAHCEEEEKKMQRKEINEEETTADDSLENYVGSLSSSGQSLPNEVRSFYEPRFGYDFSNVKVHTDTVAAKSAQSINALAYTSGNNIVFNNGQYAPNMDQGKNLLAHELTHIIHQGSATRQNVIQRTLDDDHNLNSPVLSGDIRLEETFDGNTSAYLFFGSSGEAVARVQTGLVGLGFELPQFGVDGIVGSETTKAIKEFQSDNDLVTDGIVGINTLTSLDQNLSTCSCEILEPVGRDPGIPDVMTKPIKKPTEPCKKKGAKCEVPNKPLKPKKTEKPKTEDGCSKKFKKADNFAELVTLIAAAEKALIVCGMATSIEDRIHLLRGIYYGTTWSMDFDVEKSSVRNFAFNQVYTRAGEPADPRRCLVCGLFDALKKSAEVKDGKRSVDFGHLIIGLDARRSFIARKIDIPGQGGTGLDIVTWLGDLGGGAGMLSIHRITDSTRRAKTVFGKSDFGAAVNLEGDIAAFLVLRDTSTSAASGLDLTRHSMLFTAVKEYLNPADPHSEWNSRCKVFLTLLGGTFTGNSLNNRSGMETNLQSKIKDFGLIYMINRLRQSGKFSGKAVSDASRHLTGAATEVTKIFLDIMTSCASGKTTELTPVSDPNPSTPSQPPTTGISGLGGFFSKSLKILEDVF